MAEGKRPGGLTALAVLNFVFGGLGAIGILILFALLGTKAMADATASGKIQLSASGIYVSMLFSAVATFLLIAAGVGYLKQKRVLGRGFGNGYAIVSLAGQVVTLILIKETFGIGNIIGLIYPVLTLILVNTTFKDDLVN
jgi:hypothetical protein